MIGTGFMIVEWFDSHSGGLWQIIGFADTLEQAREITKDRRGKYKIFVVMEQV